ncbi:putative oxidoreductase OrdL [Fusarium oxysporum f. sp. rapae]|nr:putative oxidoreductase OrdL [Fusarium oxysporum f. sp. rapae]
MSGALEGIYEPGVVDPGCPSPNGTTPFWHSQPHPRANHQSKWPSDIVDVVIIGAGLTGMSLIRSMLKKKPGIRIVLLDARSLCSGATGRNGGHCKTMTFAMWEERKRSFGIEEAIRLSAFEHAHLEVMANAIEEDNIDCDLCLTQGIEAYYDQKDFEKAVAGLEDMRSHAPHLAEKHTVYTDTKYLTDVLKLSPRAVGAIAVPAASMWPYKWITGVLGPLIDQDKINVQTNTPVTSITDRVQDEYATVKTARGDIRAKHVVHATNAWLGRLLPELRPFISPLRGNVLSYAPTAGGKSPLGLKSDYSLWLRYGVKDYDYLIQRKDGRVIVGRANTGRKAVGDDSQTDLGPLSHLRGFAHEALASPEADAATKVSHAWAGILAFSQDGVPFAGRLPFPGRSHQWVCGGYHATGMIKAFLTSQMVAGLILGEEPGEDFPQSIFATSDRIRQLRISLDTGGPVLTKARL